MTDHEKKQRYWEYFTTPGNLKYGFGVTPVRLRKIKHVVMCDVNFWGDMRRHGFPDDPTELSEHGQQNWAGMIHQIMLEMNIIKIRTLKG